MLAPTVEAMPVQASALQHSSLVSKQPPLAYYYTVHTKFSYVERREGAKLACRRSLLLCTEVLFTSFPSGEFTVAIVVYPPD